MNLITPNKGRVVIVAHKVPFDNQGNLKAGGMVSAIMAAMEGSNNCLWVGANEDQISNPSVRNTMPMKETHARGVDFASFPLTEGENKPFYQQMANEGLWPLMHMLDTKITEDGTAYKQYRNVNNLYAKQLMKVLKPDDIIWVHDYHLVPLASSLRSMGVDNPILFFNHIPMPTKSFVENADCDAALKRQFNNLIEMLFDYDLVGLQSKRDLDNLHTFLNTDTPSRYEPFETITRKHEGKETRIGVFPIGIEVDKVQEIVTAHRNAQKVREVQHMLESSDKGKIQWLIDSATGQLENLASMLLDIDLSHLTPAILEKLSSTLSELPLGKDDSLVQQHLKLKTKNGSNRKLIIGADRLDYTKGLIHRAQQTGQFLKGNPELHGQVQFYYITPYSRDKIEMYASEKEFYRGEVAKVNLEHGCAGWVPIQTESINVCREELLAIYQVASVGVVSSINDGMHLGAHEFTAAQDPENPGVLVLSDNVGAAGILQNGAILYNPKGSNGLALAFGQALRMPLDERQEMHGNGMTAISRYSAKRWAEENLGGLRFVRA